MNSNSDCVRTWHKSFMSWHMDFVMETLFNTNGKRDKLCVRSFQLIMLKGKYISECTTYLVEGIYALDFVAGPNWFALHFLPSPELPRWVWTLNFPLTWTNEYVSSHGSRNWKYPHRIQLQQCWKKLKALCIFFRTDNSYGLVFLLEKNAMTPPKLWGSCQKAWWHQLTKVKVWLTNVWRQ